MGSRELTSENFRMFKALISFALGISSICAFSIAKPREEFTCQECVRELREWGKLVIQSNDDIGAYLQTHWCPSVVPNDSTCHNDIELAYPMMADSIVVHFFIDGAIEMCTAEGICQAKDFQIFCIFLNRGSTHARSVSRGWSLLRHC